MSLFRRGAAETRGLSYQDVWGSGGNFAPPLNADTVNGALALIPVYSATGLICDLISTAPKEAYREGAPGVLSPLDRQPTLVTNPSPFQDYGRAISWWHQGLASVLLTGNAYGYIVAIDNAGTPTKIIWFNPNDVQIIEEQADWFHTPQYYWRGRPLDPTLVVHVPGYAIPGTVKGLSPIGLFKQQIETGLSAQAFQLDWYKNGAAPSGWFKNTAKAIPDGQSSVIKDRFKAAVKNRDLLVTGSDWDWTALGVPADQAQFLQAISANATQIAAIFRVSPDDIGGASPHPLTYKTLEQDGIKLRSRALRPWAARFEEVLSGLLPGNQKIRVNLDRIAEGTIMERTQAHAAALASGQETNEEARADWGRAPLTDEQTKAWKANYPPLKPPSVPADITGTD